MKRFLSRDTALLMTSMGMNPLAQPERPSNFTAASASSTTMAPRILGDLQHAFDRISPHFPQIAQLLSGGLSIFWAT